MWSIQAKYSAPNFYQALESELLALVKGEKCLVANLANISSWIHHSVPELNWTGFYLWEEADKELVLGPFQGLPACIRIPPSRGVCGAAYTQRKTLRVDDVHQFPGHIACDSATRSELVIPLLKEERIFGVFDLDSPSLARFTQRDEDGMTKAINALCMLVF